MRISSVEISLSQLFFLILYYVFLYYLPENTTPVFGKINCFLRYRCCRHIFKQCGSDVHIERKANFGSGRNICIGNHSGIGVNACIPSNTIIGENVMMGPNCYILAQNHKFDRTDVPMIQQGFDTPRQTIIGNDVWIGRDVLMTPGRKIADGSIIAGGCVLTKDFEPYCIIGGNPGIVIKSRK